MALLTRVALQDRPHLTIAIDGQACDALAGDTILTAVLTHRDRLRVSEFSGAPRAGYCLMGACQDCWITLEDGQRMRACSTLVVDGMRIVTTP
jgi:predicted molibdopterin-dependent oxidoreductase YjgC